MRSHPSAVRIPQELLREVYFHARESFPAECCGWLCGPRGNSIADTVRRAHNAYAPGRHPTAGDRTTQDAYLIEGAELLELDRSFRSDYPAKVIYHSSPNGRAYFSRTDREVAIGPWGDRPIYPAQQLVVALDAVQVIEAKLFAWDGQEKRDFIEVAQYAGDGNW
jgi:proteasome lid subunit RPN8/RPN11